MLVKCKSFIIFFKIDLHTQPQTSNSNQVGTTIIKQ